MNPSQIDEEAIFDVARRIDSREARSDYLQQVCGHDNELLNRLRALLEIHDREDSLLEKPPAELAMTGDVPRVFGQPGEVIGPYKLLQKIGEGGFGIVYMAEQTKPVRRKVALKIIKPGMDSREVVARFEAERQALAMMSHPNIANVLDGGTTAEGRPYFAMELVRGVSITEYCDKKKLQSKERLLLFIEICNAVQHAHQKGVIHRDLKPSNVMVTMHDGKPVIKVIDFGVAKAINQQLTSKTLFTRYGQMVGTPQYMSPEQAEMSGLDVDTRSDIYSLGVLLYELLTGSTPISEDRLKQASYAELQRMICNEELAKPSTRLSTTAEQILIGIADHRGVSPKELREQLRGDLDWIVMKTLEKERERRYGTALELASDIQRFLADETVEARSPSTSYRLQKYLRRHRALVASVAAFSSIMLIATLVSSRFAVVANTAQRKGAEQLVIAQSERLAAQQERDEKIKAVQAEAKLRESYESQASKLEKQLYRTQFMKAREALDTSEPKVFEQIVASCPEKLRDWEWQRLNFLAAHHEVRLVPARTMASFRKDGSDFLCAGGKDAPLAIRFWDTQTLDCKRTISTGIVDDHLFHCALSPDEKFLAVGSQKGTVSVLTVATGEEIWRREFIHGPSYVAGLAMSPSGENLASVGIDGMLRLWEFKTGELLMQKGPFSKLRDVEFDPSGQYIATASQNNAKDGKYRIFEAKTLTEISANDHFGSRVLSISITQDGQYIASGGQEGLVLVRSFLKGDITRVLLPNTGSEVRATQFSPDGKLLAAAGERGVVVWDTTNWQIKLRQNAGRFQLIHHLSISPDNKILSVYGNLNDGSWGTRLIGLTNVASVSGDDYSFPNNEWKISFASPTFSSDNAQIAVGGTDRLVRVFDAASGKLQRVLQGHCAALMTVLWSPDGRVIYSHDLDGCLKAWDSSSGITLWESRPEKSRLLKRYYTNLVAITPDGKRFLYRLMNGEVAVLDATTGKETSRFGPKVGEVSCVACSPDGRWIATGDEQNEIVIWAADTYQKVSVLQGHIGPVNSLAFSPDSNRLASVSIDQTTRLWDFKAPLKLGRELLSANAKSGILWSVEFSASGERIFSTGNNGRVVEWDLDDGAELLRWENKDCWLLAISPDGRTVASVGNGIRLAETADPGESVRKQRRIVQEAYALIESMDPRNVFASDKIKAIESNSVDNLDVRQAAIQFIKTEGDNAYQLNKSAWSKLLDAANADHRLALKQALRACEIAPNCSEYKLSVALGHFRVGQYQEALQAIREASNLDPNDPREFTFNPPVDMRTYQFATCAMTLYKLDEFERAEEKLKLARRSLESNPLASTLVKEAEALLQSKADSSENL